MVRKNMLLKMEDCENYLSSSQIKKVKKPQTKNGLINYFCKKLMIVHANAEMPFPLSYISCQSSPILNELHPNH